VRGVCEHALTRGDMDNEENISSMGAKTSYRLHLISRRGPSVQLRLSLSMETVTQNPKFWVNITNWRSVDILSVNLLRFGLCKSCLVVCSCSNVCQWGYHYTMIIIEIV